MSCRNIGAYEENPAVGRRGMHLHRYPATAVHSDTNIGHYFVNGTLCIAVKRMCKEQSYLPHINWLLHNCVFRWFNALNPRAPIAYPGLEFSLKCLLVPTILHCLHGC